MTRRGSLLLAATLCLGVAPALAAPTVVIDSSMTKMVVTAKSSAFGLTGVVLARSPGSRMTAEIQDGVPPGVILDGVLIDGYDMALTFDFLGAGDIYSSTGTFVLADKDATLHYDIQAGFASTDIALVTIGGSQSLEIQGTLTTMSGNSAILLGSDPWVFVGDGPDAPGDADGVSTTITVNDPSAYRSGGLVALHYPVYGNYASLEALFGALNPGDTLFNGSVHAQISAERTPGTMIPAPGAALLGLFGAGLVGLVRRACA